ncbi:hypothetical protein L1887_60205 [Cichorium endivia]|nr:hypothetical protein L1887_60205 [Cichorium endivia]
MTTDVGPGDRRDDRAEWSYVRPGELADEPARRHARIRQKVPRTQPRHARLHIYRESPVDDLLHSVDRDHLWSAAVAVRAESTRTQVVAVCGVHVQHPVYAAAAVVAESGRLHPGSRDERAGVRLRTVDRTAVSVGRGTYEHSRRCGGELESAHHSGQPAGSHLLLGIGQELQRYALVQGSAGGAGSVAVPAARTDAVPARIARVVRTKGPDRRSACCTQACAAGIGRRDRTGAAGHCACRAGAQESGEEHQIHRHLQPQASAAHHGRRLVLFAQPGERHHSEHDLRHRLPHAARAGRSVRADGVRRGRACLLLGQCECGQGDLGAGHGVQLFLDALLLLDLAADAVGAADAEAAQLHHVVCDRMGPGDGGGDDAGTATDHSERCGQPGRQGVPHLWRMHAGDHHPGFLPASRDARPDVCGDRPAVQQLHPGVAMVAVRVQPCAARARIRRGVAPRRRYAGGGSDQRRKESQLSAHQLPIRLITRQLHAPSPVALSAADAA